MKIRQGFVSNSSSSSFVIIGVHLTDKNETEIKKKFAESIIGKPLTEEDDIYDIIDNSNNYLSDDGPGYLGKVICDVNSEDGYIENSEVEINKSWDEAYEILKNFDIKKEDIKLICGTRSC